VREQPFLEPGDEHGVELEALRRVHGHELQRGAAFRGLRLPRLERGVREKRGQRVSRALLRAVLGDGAPGSTRSPIIGASVAIDASRAKLSAALTSSCRFSSRSCPSFSRR